MFYRSAFLLSLVACGPAPSTSAATQSQPKPEVQAVNDDWSYYGDKFEIDDVTLAADVLKDPSAYADKPIRIAGTVSDVCQKKGCWMVLSEGEHHMRVMMKDHKFAVNMEGTGFLCELEGTIVGKPADPEAAAHYASEGKPGAPVPEHLNPQAVNYQLIATAVRMKSPTKLPE